MAGHGPGVKQQGWSQENPSPEAGYEASVPGTPGQNSPAGRRKLREKRQLSPAVGRSRGSLCIPRPSGEWAPIVLKYQPRRAAPAPGASGASGRRVTTISPHASQPALRPLHPVVCFEALSPSLCCLSSTATTARDTGSKMISQVMEHSQAGNPRPLGGGRGALCLAPP